MSFEGTVPITGHSISFHTRSITGWEWNPDIPIDEDGDGAPDYYGDYEEDVTYYEDDYELMPGGIYAGLVTFGSVSESSGKYSTNMTVNDYIGPEGYVDYYTDEVSFGINDSNALSPR